MVPTITFSVYLGLSESAGGEGGGGETLEGRAERERTRWLRFIAILNLLSPPPSSATTERAPFGSARPGTDQR